MPNFADIKAAIADDIDDTTGEYADQIGKAVLAAIRYCERVPYYFNETRDVTFATAAGQEWYGAAAHAQIPTLVHINRAYKEDAAGQRADFLRARPEDIEALADSQATRGEPYLWTYFGQRIRIYPIPDATPYTIRLQIGPYRLASLVADDDSNAWLTEAYDMVKARAKFILAKDTLKDAGTATEALADYQDQERALKAETSARNGTGYVIPTCF